MRKAPVVLFATLAGSVALAQTGPAPQPAPDDIIKRLNALEERVTKLEGEKIQAGFRIVPPANVQEAVRKLVAKHMGVALEQVTLDTRYVDQVESLDLVDIVITTERIFAIAIPDDVACQFMKVGDIVKFIESRPKPSVQ
jgi:acyl carrier protein